MNQALITASNRGMDLEAANQGYRGQQVLSYEDNFSYDVSTRPGGDYMSASKILVPVDGSAASLRGVDFAIEMVAQNPATSLLLLHVQNVPAIELASASDAMATKWLQEAAAQASAKALKDAIGKSEGAGVAFKTLVRTGQTAEAIAWVAREEDVKHIVMGTRGLGGIKGLLLGSVATQVIHLAEVPITLIK